MHLVNYNFFPVLKRLHLTLIDLGKGMARWQRGQVSITRSQIGLQKIERDAVAS